MGIATKITYEGLPPSGSTILAHAPLNAIFCLRTMDNIPVPFNPSNFIPTVDYEWDRFATPPWGDNEWINHAGGHQHSDNCITSRSGTDLTPYWEATYRLTLSCSTLPAGYDPPATLVLTYNVSGQAVECTEPQYAICNDGSQVMIRDCIGGVYSTTGEDCPDPPDCNWPLFANCPDGTSIKTHDCINGRLVQTEQECAAIPVDSNMLLIIGGLAAAAIVAGLVFMKKGR